GGRGHARRGAGRHDAPGRRHLLAPRAGGAGPRAGAGRVHSRPHGRRLRGPLRLPLRLTRARLGLTKGAMSSESSSEKAPAGAGSEAQAKTYYDDFSGWYERERSRGYHVMLDDIEV